MFDLVGDAHPARLRKISQIKTVTGTLQIEGNTLDKQAYVNEYKAFTEAEA